MLTPQTHLFLENLKNLNLPLKDQIPIELLRDQFETASVLYGGNRLDESITYHDSTLTLQYVDRPIKVRFFDVEDPKGIILYAHGGGWICGSLNTHHVMCQSLAQATNSRIFSIEYSLAPECVYPTALNEIEAVYKWTLKQNMPVSVAGDSAGANLMAGLIVRLNKQQFSLPKDCIFFYPSFDLTGKLESLNEFSEGYMLTKHSIKYYISNYLGKNSTLEIYPEVSPLWQMDKIVFPPTLIVAAEYDPLRDDARIAKDILEQKGTLKGYLEIPGVIHGFVQLPGLFPESAKVFDWISKFYS